ncbi:siroheme synthase CysG [Actibacterium ureilyticum]|uniref:siroheme synthase CysG n=1 Tax=Actibacterium ureilyticum TaxID=1590614 RepID=UPI000BAAF79E|nr:siroheme synthase CysG [Actibacterium ureilyticum]
MKSFPMFVKTTDRHVVIAGGGEQAAQKARLMLKTDARIVLLAPALDEELSALVAEGRADWRSGPITPDSFAGCAMGFIATGCPAVDFSLHALAKAGGAMVNVVDRPELCDITTPSIVDRDPVVVAIGTEGTAPVLARRIKTDIEQQLDPRLGAFAALAGRLRGAVAARVPMARRRAFWRSVFGGPEWQEFRSGNERSAAQALKARIAEGGESADDLGRIALIGAGPGARDLLTLRAVERLQEADVIFYDRLVDPDVLELARRDAERVFVGKTVGASDWPQDRINALIVSAAQRGQNVVRLKSGDPSIFGRATEEMDAARAAGIPVEIVPGVTAASAAAASLGRSLSERGETDHVILATGTCRPGDAAPSWGTLMHPGTTLVLYMAVHKARALQDNLMDSGLAPDSGVEIVSRASHADERISRTSLADLAEHVEREGIGSPSILIVRRPKAQAAPVQLKRA